MKTKLFVAVAFPATMIEEQILWFDYNRKADEMYQTYGKRCAELETLRIEWVTKHKEMIHANPVTVFLTLDSGHILNKFDFDSECGYYQYILILSVDLPSSGGFEEEIKWLKLKEGEADEYEEVERPYFFKNTGGFFV